MFEFLDDAQFKLKSISWYRGMDLERNDYFDHRISQCYELDYIIKSNDGMVLIDNIPYCCKPGTIIFRGPGHRIAIKGRYESFYIELYIDSSKKVEYPIEIDSLSPNVYALMYELNNIFKGVNIPHKKFSIQRIIYDIFGEIIKACGEHDGKFSRDNVYANVITYINDHYTEKLTLERIAEDNQLSKYTLCRYFKEKLGISISDYIEIIRINNSAVALNDENKVIKEICYENGFQSMATFFRAFKKVTGKTPAEYRQHINSIQNHLSDINTPFVPKITDTIHTKRAPLTRDEVIAVIEGKSKARRVPMYYHGWIDPEIFGENKNQMIECLNEYPFDFEVINLLLPDKYNAPADDPSYRFMHRDPLPAEPVNRALDAQAALKMEEIDDMIADFPDADYPGIWQQHFGEKTKYRVLYWFYCLFERHWWLRGMENALTDFYEYPEETHKLYQALTDFYIKLVLNCRKYHDIDGIYITDSLGTQKSAFFSIKIFREFFKPYYSQLVKAAHEAGIHVWLHSCGNVMEFIDDFVDIGFDVIHPIQKYSMNEIEAAAKINGRMTILAGLDVQRIIPNGTEEDVRNEVRNIIDTYSRENGRLMMTLGNVASVDCPIENIRAILDETYEYGKGK